MILQELFVKFAYLFDKSGVERAKQGTKELDESVNQVDRSLDRVNARFDALGIAATAAAAAGVAAYTRLNAVLVEFSGKSGQSLNDFRQFTSEANRVARNTGTANESVIEQMQRIYSLGGDKEQANALSRAASILESRQVASGTWAVESAMALQNVGLGDAMSNLQMTFAAGQTGPGVMEDYFRYSQLLSGVLGGIAGVPLDQILGALTVVGAGGRLSTGASGLEEVISSLFRDAGGPRSKFYAERTGGTWSDMQDAINEGGLPAFIRLMAEHFDEQDLFELFGSKEAARSIALLMADPSKLDANIRAINDSAQSDAIGRFGDETAGEFSVVMKNLTETLQQVLEQFGEPFAKFFTPFLRVLNLLLNGILALNESTGGLIGWIAALGTALFALPRAFRLMRGALAAVGTAADALSAFGDRDRAGRNDRGGKRRTIFGQEFDEKSFGSGLGSGAVGGAIGATFAWGGAALLRSWRSVMGMVTAVLHEARVSLFAIRNSGQVFTASRATAQQQAASSLYRTALLPVLKLALSPLGKALALLVAAFSIFPMLYSKLTNWNAPSVLAATRRDAQADHFRAGGARGDEPAPGIADIAAANRAFAEAEKSKLSEELMSLVRERLGFIRGLLPDFLVGWIDVAIDVITGFFKGVHDIISGIGLFWREFFADPRAAISMAWDMAMGKSAEIDSAIYSMLIKALGGEPSEQAKALGAIVEGTSTSTLTQPTIQLTPEDAAAFGITGDYSKALNAPNVDNLELPTPHGYWNAPNIPAPPTFEFRMGDINITGPHADDRFELARSVREEVETAFKNSADYIIQEMDTVSP